MPNEERIYWDSCVYVSLIEQTVGRFHEIEPLFRAIQRGEYELHASAMIVAEVSKLKREDLTGIVQAKMIAEFMRNEFIMISQVDRKLAEEAVVIQQTYGIKPVDAIHVATAIKRRCTVLYTYDGETGGGKKLLAFNNRIGTPPLRIELPKYTPKAKQGMIAFPSDRPAAVKKMDARVPTAFLLNSRPQRHPMRQTMPLQYSRIR